MQIGICTSVETFESAPAGVDYLEPTVAELLCPDQSQQESARRGQHAALAVRAANCLIPGQLKTTGPQSDPQQLDAYMQTVLDRAAAAGLDVLVFGSGGSRRLPDGFDPAEATDQLADHLRRWAPLASGAGVIICIEPLSRGDCNIIHTVDEAAELARRVDHTHIRVLCDTYHMSRNDDAPEAIVRAGDLIAHVHVADPGGRAPLLKGGADQRPFFAALKQVGYTGGVSIEATWQDIHQQLPEAIGQLRRQIDSA
ncbi:MAG: sugar phosphate isomerase/epimerase family protein [Phycisphaerae bacterium]